MLKESCTSHHSPVSTTSEGRGISSEVRLENCTQVLGVGQKWTACDSRLRKNIASHLFWPFQTCPNLFKPVHNTVTMYARRAMSFFALSNALLLQCYVVSCWNCTFNSPNTELSNFIQLMELYWSKIVDPSRSPCLKIVNRKRFERRNFLVLRSVLLKNAYFNSANPELTKEVWLVELW